MRVAFALVAALLLASPALAADPTGCTQVNALSASMMWSPAVPPGNVYESEVSWNDQAEEPHLVTVRNEQIPVNAPNGPNDFFRLRARACLGTLDARTTCGPWSPWSNYVCLNTPIVTPGAPSKPTIDARVLCDKVPGQTKLVWNEATGELSCVAP